MAQFVHNRTKPMLHGLRSNMNSAFSEFIRNAPEAEKRAVYLEVLRKATERQRSQSVITMRIYRNNGATLPISK